MSPFVTADRDEIESDIIIMPVSTELVTFTHFKISYL